MKGNKNLLQIGLDKGGHNNNQNRDTSVGELCKELGITRPTLYRYVSPNGELREFGNRVLEK
jgi:predicted DNA-binding transcriptional regulator AlpA